ncbi:MAG: Uma2 family endonuclease [Leptospiraceae bacterium]|nr:Uma2 family endonuclease [Leptospiraceae bacterium]MCP5495547.1 Uma2 family endonuclease [Leptospiraceae bacterium]
MTQITTMQDTNSVLSQLYFDESLETTKHQDNMSILVHSLEEAWKYLDDFYILGNMFMYYNPNTLKYKDLRGPDFFLVNEIYNDFDSKSWVIWEENWNSPDLIIELLSNTNNELNLKSKKELYEQVFRAKEYFIFDPNNPSNFQGWQLNQENVYIELNKNNHGWLWSDVLKCWLGLWNGVIKEKTDIWLRFYDANHKLILLPSEIEQQEKEFLTLGILELEALSKDS